MRKGLRLAFQLYVVLKLVICASLIQSPYMAGDTANSRLRSRSSGSKRDVAMPAGRFVDDEDTDRTKPSRSFSHPLSQTQNGLRRTNSAGRSQFTETGVSDYKSFKYGRQSEVPKRSFQVQISGPNDVRELANNKRYSIFGFGTATKLKQSPAVDETIAMASRNSPRRSPQRGNRSSPRPGLVTTGPFRSRGIWNDESRAYERPYRKPRSVFKPSFACIRLAIIIVMSVYVSSIVFPLEETVFGIGVNHLRPIITAQLQQSSASATSASEKSDNQFAYLTWEELGNAHVFVSSFAHDTNLLFNSFHLRQLESLTLPAMQEYYKEGGKFFWIITIPDATDDANLFDEKGDYERLLDLEKEVPFLALVRTSSFASSVQSDISGTEVRELCLKALHGSVSVPGVSADAFKEDQYISFTMLAPGTGLSRDFLFEVQSEIKKWNDERPNQAWPPAEADREQLPIRKEWQQALQQIYDDGTPEDEALGPALLVCSYNNAIWRMQRSTTAAGIVTLPSSKGQCEEAAVTFTMSSTDRVKRFKAEQVFADSTRWYRGMHVALRPGELSPIFTIHPTTVVTDKALTFTSNVENYAVDSAKLFLANKFVIQHIDEFKRLNVMQDYQF